MSDKGTPHNVGQAIFEGFGKGLTALSGILEQDRQNKIQDLQLQMNMEVQQARMEQLRVSTALNQEALNIAHELPEETRLRKQFEAETETLIQIQQTEDLLQAAFTRRTGQEGFVPFASAFGGLQQTAETQGLDFTVATPTGDFEFGGAAPPGIDINTIQGFAASQGLEVDDIKFGKTGEIDFVSLGRPTQPLGGETDANKRARLKEEDRRARESVISEANIAFQGIPQEVREKAGVGVITNINDLKKILIEKGATGKRKFIFDWLRSDDPKAKAVHDQLIGLANRYAKVGGTANKSDVDKALELLGG